MSRYGRGGVSPEKKSRLTSGKRKHLVSCLACLAALVIGLAAMNGLAGLKKPPARETTAERVLPVQTVQAVPENVRVRLIGYGPARVLNTVAIAPEVSGRIAFIHPDLEAGGVIHEDETLFRIEEADYRARYQEAEAFVAQKVQEIERLRLKKELDQKRLQTLKRNVELAGNELERLRRLHGRSAMATQSQVDQAEQTVNAALERYEQLEQAVSLAPIQIKETGQALEAAKARRDLARTNLGRCRVVAPFTGRVITASLEKGHYVTPGQPVLDMADDSILEIHVPLDSQDARRWLRFKGQDGPGSMAWFAGLQEVDCRIGWTENGQQASWTGRLHRPVRFDQESRTLTVAVRVSGREASKSRGSGLPLVEGMFCRVSIPGKLLEDVYKIPREAVSFDNRVYLAEGGRLKTVEVTVARIQDGAAYISEGLSAGSRVITTRLVDPLENSLLDIRDGERPGESS